MPSNEVIEALVTRVAELEKRVAELEGARKEPPAPEPAEGANPEPVEGPDPGHDPDDDLPF